MRWSFKSSRLYFFFVLLRLRRLEFNSRDPRKSGSNQFLVDHSRRFSIYICLIVFEVNRLSVGRFIFRKREKNRDWIKTKRKKGSWICKGSLCGNSFLFCSSSKFYGHYTRRKETQIISKNEAVVIDRREVVGLEWITVHANAEILCDLDAAGSFRSRRSGFIMPSARNNIRRFLGDCHLIPSPAAERTRRNYSFLSLSQK